MCFWSLRITVSLNSVRTEPGARVSFGQLPSDLHTGASVSETFLIHHTHPSHLSRSQRPWECVRPDWLNISCTSLTFYSIRDVCVQACQECVCICVQGTNGLRSDILLLTHTNKYTNCKHNKKYTNCKHNKRQSNDYRA